MTVNPNQPKRVPLVTITATKPRLMGTHYAAPGDVVRVPADLADKLCGAGCAVHGEQKNLKQAQKEAAQQRPPQTTQTVEDVDTASFEDVGLSEKIVDLLEAAEPPITSVKQLRSLIAIGTDLTAIEGIGEATSASIVAALKTFDEAA